MANSSRNNIVMLEDYGCPTPVFVQESLINFTDVISSQDTSFNFDTSGWCWLVFGRSCHFWNFRISKSACYTLTLPQTGLKHDANLVSSFIAKSKKNALIPGCVCVSPEGVVRSWVKLDCTTAYSEVSIDLAGQVAQSLVKLQNGRDFVLITSTCSMYLICGSNDNLKPINIHPIKSGPTGLSSFGRRVSSFLFTSTPANDIKLINAHLVLQRSVVEDDCNFLLLMSTKMLTCWKMNSSNADESRICWEVDIQKILVDEVLKNIWHIKSPAAQLQMRPTILTQLIDFTIYDNQVFVLIGTASRAISEEASYSLATLQFYETKPATLETFVQLKDLNQRFSATEEIEFEEYRLRHMHGTPGIFFVGKSIVGFSDSGGNCSLLPVEKDRIIGSGSYSTHVLVFTLKNALLSLKFSDRNCTNLPAFAEEMSIMKDIEDLEGLESLATNGDDFQRFRAAFMLYLRQELALAEQCMDKLFDTESNFIKKSQLINLNELVADFARDIIDSYPDFDARWENFNGGSNLKNITSSLLAAHQLEDKKKTLNLFVEFLKRMRLWDQVTYVVGENTNHSMNVRSLLAEYLEKLDACRSVIAKDWSELNPVLKCALREICAERQDAKVGDVVPLQDQFYRKISGCHDIIYALIQNGANAIGSMEDPIRAVDLVLAMNQYLLTFLNGAKSNRAQDSYIIEKPVSASGSDVSNSFNELWTCEPEFAKPALEKQTQLTLQYTEQKTVLGLEGRKVALLAQQAAELIGHLLTDFEFCLAKVANQKLAKEKSDEYREYRRRLLAMLFDSKQYDHLARLAEQFRDFDLLVHLCDTIDDEALLQKYRQKFATDHFERALNDYYLREKKYPKLIAQNCNEVRKFLHAEDRDDLLWIMLANDGHYRKAADCLQSLASQEKDLLAKKKTLLSLAKLSSLCEDVEPSSMIKELNKKLDVVFYQEAAPQSALKAHGINKDEMPPFSVQELIELYTLDPEADEWGFIKAADLLGSNLFSVIPSDEFNRIKTSIWARSIMRDNWESVILSDDPQAESKSTLFMKAVELFVMASKETPLDCVKALLPTASDLLACEELERYSENVVFQHIMKAGQEKLTIALKSRIDVSV